MDLHRWWKNVPGEHFWLEVTDRPDMGADLHAPQRKEGGSEFWSYSLILELDDGDIVFHYSKPEKSIVGFSMVSGDPWKGETIWSARGTSARSKGLLPYPRPGFWRGLQYTTKLAHPISLETIRSRRDEVLSIPKNIEQSLSPPSYFPFHSYGPTSLRPAEGYLFKLPTAFVTMFGLPQAASDPESGSAKPPSMPPESVSTPLTGGVAYQYADEDVAVSKAEPMSIDPALVERALKSHRSTQNALATMLLHAGLTPLRPAPGDPDWDIAWEKGSAFYVTEVKSITKRNEERQLRLAIGQVLRYRQAISSHGYVSVVPIIAVEREPADHSWVELCESLGVRLTWPPEWHHMSDLV